MAKITVLNVDPTGHADVAPSASPGALVPFGFTDLFGSKLGIKTGTFYLDANGVFQHANIPIIMSAQDGGEVQVDMNPLPTGHPVENFNGGISIFLNAVSGAGSGYSILFDNSPQNPVVAVGGIRRVLRSTVAPGLNRLRVTFRCISAGPGLMDCHYSIRDLANSLNLLDSGAVAVDARSPYVGGTLPAANVASLGGFYPSWGLIIVSAYDGTGPLNVVDDPYADWRSKTVIRIIGQIPNGGTGTYTYQWYYRKGTTASWSKVGTDNSDTGTSPSCTKHGLAPGTSYQFYRTTFDGTTMLTSVTITASTAAAGAGSYIALLMGDSITEGEGAPTGPIDRNQALVTALGSLGIESRFMNMGEGGTTSSSANAFKASFAAIAADLVPDAVDVMFGTNDVNAGPISQATYQFFMDACAAALQAVNTRFVMHCPIFQQGLTAPNEALLGPPTLSTGYPAALANIASLRSNSFMGDTASWATFQTNVATWFDSVGEVHPNALGYSAGLGPDEASAIQTLLTQWNTNPPRSITGVSTMQGISTITL